MKKILLIVLAVVVAAVLVGVFIYRQQSGYTKVLTAKIAGKIYPLSSAAPDKSSPEPTRTWALPPLAVSPTSTSKKAIR